MIKIRNKKYKITLREDRAILLSCIGIALVFWLLVKLSQTYRTEKSVTLNFSLPAGKTFRHYPPDDVKAQIEGSGWDLMFSYFNSNRVELGYNLEEIDQFTLNRGQLRADISRALSFKDIIITEVNYDNVEIVLEEEATRKIPIQLAYKIDFAPEFHLQNDILLTPDSVNITGPNSIIENIVSWPSDSLKLENIKANLVQTIDLTNPSKEISITPTSVQVNINVEQFTEKSLFVPVVVKNAPDSIKIFPEIIKLSCVLGLSHYNELDPEDFQLEVDLQKIPVNKGRNTAPIQIAKSPEYIRNITFSHKSVEFFLLR